MGEFRALEDRCGGELVLVVILVIALAVLLVALSVLATLRMAVLSVTALGVVLGELVRGRGWGRRGLVFEGFRTGAAEVGAVDARGSALLAVTWSDGFILVVIGAGRVVVVGTVVVVVVVVGEDLDG